MDNNIRPANDSLFDQVRHIDENGAEYWYARELGPLLGYVAWRKFNTVVSRAEESLKNTDVEVKNHFAHLDKMVAIGSRTERHIADVKLTRYACYIIAQNGNATKKPEIAAAQAYFAVKTRRQEITEAIRNQERLEARNKFDLLDTRLTEALVEKDMAPQAIPVIKEAGYKKLFGGKTNEEMRQHYGVTNPNEQIADQAPNILLTAKSLANEMTAHNLEQYPIDTFDEIKGENEDNNKAVRQTLIRRGITPETLPPEKDTKLIGSN